MSFTNIKNKDQGFTIVELLIVVVVIAILAAITIVSYNGITARANTSTAQSLAANVAKKAEMYAADDSTVGYPLTSGALTAAGSSTKAFYIPASQVSFTSGPTVAPDNTNGKTTVRFLKCAASGTTQASITATNITGVRIQYFDFTDSTVKDVNTGVTTACPAAT